METCHICMKQFDYKQEGNYYTGGFICDMCIMKAKSIKFPEGGGVFTLTQYPIQGESR
jgi:hypothetical protein